MNYERKRVQVMRYDGYLLMACIVLFIITLLQPGIAQLQPLLWLLHTIDTIFQTPLLKWVIGFFAFIYMLSIIFRGIKFSDEVFALITNRKKPNQADAQENQGYTDYEEITDDDSQLPK